MLHILFLAIQQYLLSQLSDVAYIRMWNKQPDFLESGGYQDIVYPAILVEFVDPLEWKQLGNGVQIIENLIIRLHYIDEELDGGGGTMDQNLDIYALTDEVFKAFQDWMPSTLTISASDSLYSKWAGTYTVPVGVMVRGNEEQDPGHTNLYHYKQEYETTWVTPQMERPVGGSIAGDLTYDLEKAVAWDSATAYVVGNAVISGNNIYACLANNTNQEPPNVTYWTLLGPVPTNQVPYVPILNQN